jgi:hypothetical protein
MAKKPNPNGPTYKRRFEGLLNKSESPILDGCQADRLIRKFGGVPNLHQSLARAGFPIEISAIYKWRYPISKGGTGGFVPSWQWPAIFKAARLEGLFIQPEDMDVRSKLMYRDKKAFYDRYPEALKAKVRKGLAVADGLDGVEIHEDKPKPTPKAKASRR